MVVLPATPVQAAIAVWAAAFSGGAALGPVIGGLLLEHFWWGSIFLINVPIVVVGFVLAGGIRGVDPLHLTERVVSGEMSPEDAMDAFAEAVTEIAGADNVKTLE